MAEPILTPVLAEKTVLVGLVALVFASFLPGVNAGAFELLTAVAVITAFNAAIASWQGRRGNEWNDALAEFMTMLAANAVIILGIAFMARWSNATLSGGSALFYSVLLSLLITLYDRYRHLRFWWFVSKRARPPLTPVD